MSVEKISLEPKIDLMFAMAAELKLGGMDWKTIVEKLGADGPQIFEFKRQYPQIWQNHLDFAFAAVKIINAMQCISTLTSLAQSESRGKATSSASIVLKYLVQEMKMKQAPIDHRHRMEYLERKEEIRQVRVKELAQAKYEKEMKTAQQILKTEKAAENTPEPVSG